MSFTVEKMARPAVGVTRFNLPMPPSANNMFVNGARGRFTSPEYKAWQEDAGYRLVVARPKRFTGPVDIRLTFKEPTRRCDIDNRIKPTLDLLVKHHVIPADDNTIVRSIHACWGDVGGVCVEIEAAIARVAA